MFTAALFTKTEIWKNMCPSTDEWIKKMQYIYKMESHSAIKKEENLVIFDNTNGP